MQVETVQGNQQTTSYVKFQSTLVLRLCPGRFTLLKLPTPKSNMGLWNQRTYCEKNAWAPEIWYRGPQHVYADEDRRMEQGFWQERLLPFHQQCKGKLGAVHVVLVRNMLLALERRKFVDDRSFGKLFMLVVDELADITFSHSMQLIVTVMLDCIREAFRVTGEQIEKLTQIFLANLPEAFQSLLSAA